MLHRLHWAAVITTLAGMAALATLALSGSFLVVFACLCVSTLAGFIMVAAQQKQKRMLEQASVVLAACMRGQWGARLQPDTREDALSRLQHRINNVLDALDLHVRGPDAAIDFAHHAEYIEKLRATALMASLQQQKPIHETEHDRHPSHSVGALLQQLGHDVAGLFHPSPAPLSTPTADADGVDAIAMPMKNDTAQLYAEHVHALRAALQRVQAATRQLEQRAVLPASEAHHPAGVSAMEHAMVRMSEQLTVISLNIAMQSSRGQGNDTLGDMSDELRGVATQLHKLRADMASVLTQAMPVAHTAQSVPLAYAVEALTQAAHTLQERIDAVQDTASRGSTQSTAPHMFSEQAA